MFESKPRSVLSLGIILILVYLSSIPLPVESKCNKGCDLALASFYIWRGTNLTYIAELFSISSLQEIVDYNNNHIPNHDSIIAATRINIPFSCDCLDGGFLGHVFPYKVKSADFFGQVATSYSDLTTSDTNVTLNVVVNCSCGDRDVSKDYGLFVTYPIRVEDNLTSITSETNVSADLIRRYNPGVDSKFDTGRGILFIPGRDKSGNFPPLPTSTGISGGAIAGVSIGAIAVVLLLAGLVYVGCYRKKAQKVFSSLDHLHQSSHGRCQSLFSIEFTYEELATATNDFSIANKIGQGGFGAVYYAELRGEKAAIKKMDMEATREFLAELKVLTHVHHLNLVKTEFHTTGGMSFLMLFSFSSED
nr:chitin elicitor receptor kinase 1-like isoform X1 [Nicotiana tomentosiformis]